MPAEHGVACERHAGMAAIIREAAPMINNVRIQRASGIFGPAYMYISITSGRNIEEMMSGFFSSELAGIL